MRSNGSRWLTCQIPALILCSSEMGSPVNPSFLTYLVNAGSVASGAAVGNLPSRNLVAICHAVALETKIMLF